MAVLETKNLRATLAVGDEVRFGSDVSDGGPWASTATGVIRSTTEHGAFIERFREKAPGLVGHLEGVPWEHIEALSSTIESPIGDGRSRGSDIEPGSIVEVADPSDDEYYIDRVVDACGHGVFVEGQSYGVPWAKVLAVPDRVVALAVKLGAEEINGSRIRCKLNSACAAIPTEAAT